MSTPYRTLSFFELFKGIKVPKGLKGFKDFKDLKDPTSTFLYYLRTMNKKITIHPYSSPCGELMLGSFDNRLCLCDWQSEKHRGYVDKRLKRILKAEFEEGISPVIEMAMAQLDEYFAMKRCYFDIPLLFIGSDFQKKVWNNLLGIPYGKTISYGEMARNIGMPKAVRAVANANGANAISIFAPCHRVIGSNGTLTGYGGGLNAKKYLLQLEGHTFQILL